MATKIGLRGKDGAAVEFLARFPGADDTREAAEKIRARLGDERFAAYAARFRVVGVCRECGRELVAEEVVPHRLNHVPESIRGLARDVAALPPEKRLELFALFNRRTGKLEGAE